MFEIVLTDKAVKDLQNIDKMSISRIGKKLKEYSKNPLVHSKPLIHFKIGSYRFRVGDYRIVFDLEDNKIIILRIGHRKDIYK